YIDPSQRIWASGHLGVPARYRGRPLGTAPESEVRKHLVAPPLRNRWFARLFAGGSRISNHWYRVMRSRFRERLMLPPLDFPPPEKSALTGDETADASRRTDGSNPVPSSGESGANLSLVGIRLSRSRSRGFPRLSGPGRAAWVGRDARAREYLAERR